MNKHIKAQASEPTPIFRKDLDKEADKPPRITPLPAPKREWVGLSDADRQSAFESMPDMLDGFLKTWGWLHFSRAIETKLKELNHG